MKGKGLFKIHGHDAVIGRGAFDFMEPQPVPSERFINPALLSHGELELLFELERLELLYNYYGDRTYRKGIEMVTDSLSKGIHDALGIGYFGSLEPELQEVAKTIVTAKTNTFPASWLFSFQRTQKVPRNRISGFDPNAPIAPLRDCEEEYPFPGLGGDTDAWRRKIAACEAYNERILGLNEYLGDSAHHLLYNFLKDSSILKPERVSKVQLHRLVISRLANMIGVSRSTVQSWCRNGVMRHNYKKGGKPLLPEETIIGAREKAEADGHIRGFGLGTLIAIISAIATAVTATKALINSFKEDEKQMFLQQAPGIGTPEFGLEYTSDFGLKQVPPPGGGGGDGGGGGNGGGGEQQESNGSGLILAVVALIGGVYISQQ